MQGTIQNYTLDMADDRKKEPLRVKQGDTNSRWARISLTAFGAPWSIPAGKGYISVKKVDGTAVLNDCTVEGENQVLAPISEQVAAVPGIQQAELYFLAVDGDIKSQTFPIQVLPAIMDQRIIESSNEFGTLQTAILGAQEATSAAQDAAAEAMVQAGEARDAAEIAMDAAASIDEAVQAAAAAKTSETNAKASEAAAAQTKADVEALKEGFIGYDKIESGRKYANALTTTAEGEGQVSVKDAWDAPVVDMEIDGASEQVTTTGAQLLDIKLPSTTTRSGVTISLTEDGGIHLNGTATAAGNHRLIEPARNVEYNLDVATLSLISTSPYDGGISLCDTLPTNGWVTLLNTKSGKSNTGALKTTCAGCFVTFVAGTTYDVTLYPMLNVGSTALPWEPYTGGQPSPSPAYPQEIKGVEHVVNSGAQLFDAKSVVYANNASSARDITRTNTGVKFTTVAFNNSVGVFSENPIAYTGPCTISCDITASTNEFNKVRIKLGNVDMQKDFNASDFVNGKAHASISGHITEVKTITLYVDNAGKSTPITMEFSNIMINTGSTAHPWEPYNNQQRETDLQVDIAGKNSFNKEAAYSYNVNGVNIVQTDGGLRIYNNTARTYACAAVKVKLKPNTAYTYSCKIASPRTKSAVGIRKSLDNGNSFGPTMISGTGVVTIAQTISRTFTTDENEYYAVCLFCTYDEEATGDTTFESIQLEEGGTMTAWEPYHEPQSVTIPLDEPLRGIGDVKDKIVWRDGMWGIERQFGMQVFDGSADEAWVAVLNSNGLNYRNGSNFVQSKVKSKGAAICTTLIKNNGVTSSRPGFMIAGNASVLVYSNDFNTSDVSLWTAYLAENPMTIVYELAAPTWEPFPAETQTALNALTTRPGTTYLTVNSTDVAAPVRLTYVQDTRKVIDALQLDVAEQMVELQAQIDQLKVTNNLA